MHTCNMMAVDIGAGSGRSILGTFNGRAITLSELERVPNGPKLLMDRYHWDVLFLMDFIYQSLRKADNALVSIGIDTWGVDFAFLDKNKALLSNPRSYRDPSFHKKNMLETAELFGGEKALFAMTGVPVLEYNSLCQLHSMMKNNEIPENVGSLLMIPNLIDYFLSGVIHCEYSIASTTQLFDMARKEWSQEIIGKLGLSLDIFPAVGYAGRELGRLSHGVVREIGHDMLKVIAVAGHDTASAEVAVPSDSDDFTFISSGSMSVMGMESTVLVADENIIKNKIWNEGTRAGTYRLTVNMNGLWIINCCKNYWQKNDPNITFNAIEKLAERAEPHRCFINTEEYWNPGNYPEMIQAFCRDTGQYIPQSIGEIARCIFESMAMEYTFAYDGLKNHMKDQSKIYIVGGGSKNELLNQFTANSLGIPVITGPSEATVIGNLIVQLETLGEINGAAQKKDLIMQSFESKVYIPQDKGQWNNAYERYCELIKTKIAKKQ